MVRICTDEITVIFVHEKSRRNRNLQSRGTDCHLCGEIVAGRDVLVKEWCIHDACHPSRSPAALLSVTVSWPALLVLALNVVALPAFIVPSQMVPATPPK